MSLNVCAHCTTRFAIGLEHCPQCGNADYHEEGAVAKISRHGGATYVGDAPVEEPALAVEEPTEEEPAEEPADELEEPEGHDLIAEVVPEGTVDEIVTWTEGDTDPPARLLAALDAERGRPTPRVTLVSELERPLGQF